MVEGERVGWPGITFDPALDKFICGSGCLAVEMKRIEKLAFKASLFDNARRRRLKDRYKVQARPAKAILVDERTLVRAEKRLGVTFPEEYRAWLSTIGYGVGPSTGLMPIEEAHEVQLPQGTGRLGEFAVPPIFDLGTCDDPNGIGEFSHISQVTPEDISRVASAKECITLKSASGIIAINEGHYGSYEGIVSVGPLRGVMVTWIYDKYSIAIPPDGQHHGAVLIIEADTPGFLTWIDRSMDH